MYIEAVLLIKYTILYCVCENFWDYSIRGPATIINYSSDTGSGQTELQFWLRFRFRQKVWVPTVLVPQHGFLNLTNWQNQQ